MIVTIDGVSFGGGSFVIIGGPCAVESRKQLLTSANYVKQAGAHMLRGGAFKPRTSPYSFQGLQDEGLVLLKEAKELTGLPTVCEVTDIFAVEEAVKYVDALQIGARNMQNFSLLREVGRAKKPVILKRGLSATIDEWLFAAEYIKAEGNNDIILCERGIRTYEPSTRNTLDISAVPVVKSRSELPIIVDPSHATGVSKYVIPLSLASVAAGADGVMIEMHPNPELALSDGPQSLNPQDFFTACEKIAGLHNFMSKQIKGSI